MKFLKSKKFWLILLTLIIIGVLIYFILAKPPEKISQEELPEEIRRDKIPPFTAVVSPENKSWWNQDFEVVIDDSDIGSGLVDFLSGERGCKYLVEDLWTNQASGGFRKCDLAKIIVPVGLERTCSSSYSKENFSLGKCKVSTLAFDKNGNDSGWRSRTFNIDLIKPVISEISLNGNYFELNKTYLLEAWLSDNSKIAGCWFYVNGRIVEEITEIKPIPCENEEQCIVSLNYSFEKEGDFKVMFGCVDIAENFGLGSPVEIKITTNHPPQVSSCKINPTKGTTQTQFQFDITANDPDNDQMLYLWDFGDGKSSTDKSPVHLYEGTGTFEPKVSVSDKKGGESKCSTAWVVVE